MAEQRYDEVDRNETMEPRNPPNSVLTKSARRAAVWSYFVPVVVLFAVIGVALVYWSNQTPRSQTGQEPSEIGTTGRTDGGSSPGSRPSDAREEVKFRAGDLSPVTSLSELRDVNGRTMAGRRVEMDEVKIDSASGNVLWIRDGDRKFAIVTPQGAPSVPAGATIALAGQIAPDAQGGFEVVADRVTLK